MSNYRGSWRFVLDETQVYLWRLKLLTAMQASTIAPPDQLARLGMSLLKKIHYQSAPEQLVQDSLRLNEAVLSDSGALVIRTGEFTGRSPKDRFIVSDDGVRDLVHWNEFNIPMEEESFDEVCLRMKSYMARLPELWVRDCYACADPRFRMRIRVVAEKPWAALFAYNMFLRPEQHETEDFEPEWQVFVAPGLALDPAACGTRREHAVVISFRHKMIVIAGTGYTGEIKKSIFSVLNLLLPHFRSTLSMHCSANMGESGDTALYFGLSGTGKTTLSADPERRLIGDDEHGWSGENIFNFEGGCYAKVIHLGEDQEPEIYRAIRPGALLENTVFFPGTNKVDYSLADITENTRVSYPIDFISNAARPSVGTVPSNIFFLTCDAYGVLPPVSRLTPDQAMYHFISGYTAKIAGTETGINEPVSTFSACFGAPFLPLHPRVYAAMLGEKIRKHRVNVWLINTGWTGGPYSVGSRIRLKFTRNIISAVLKGQIDNVHYDSHPVFGVAVPAACPGVPSELLYPRDTWADKEAYDLQARMLAQKFVANFGKYREGVGQEVLAAAPRT